MRRSTGMSAVALAAVMIVTGCASSGGGSEFPQTPPPPQTSDPSATPSPSITADAGRADWVIDEVGIGPIALGVPFDDAVAELPPDAETEEANCPWIAWWNSAQSGTQVYVARDAEGDGESPVILVATSVFGAAFDDPGLSQGPTTEEGIGVGSTLEELAAAYPDSVTVEGFHGVVYQQVGTMFFGHRDGSPITQVIVTAGTPPLEICG